MGAFNIFLGLGGLALVVLICVYIRHSGRKKRREAMRYIESIAPGGEGVAAGSLVNLALPVLIFRAGDKRPVFCNQAFSEASGIDRERVNQISIDDLFPEGDLRWLTSGGIFPDDVSLGARAYSVFGSITRQNTRGSDMFVTLYFIDVTELRGLSRRMLDRSPVVSVLMVDNYEEMTNGIGDAARSQMVAAVEEKLSAWATPANGLFRRFERDKYLFIFEEQYLRTYIDDKFSILDTVREIASENGISASLSIGMGKNGDTLLDDLKNAQFAIDMALSRGGDQVVIRNKIDFSFFGGRTRTVEKRTKVKSRVMANALSELIADSSRVLVMGHKAPDLDALGASVGIACICRKLGKPCGIVYDPRDCSDIQPLHENMLKLQEYRESFINPEDALLSADVRTLLVVVDVNRPVVVASRPLLESCTRVAVIDHHRRASDYIEQVDFNFHEPYASSTCEMITELLSYIMEQQDILRSEAEALLSGIMLDTKNFTLRTGVRTFEAAAWLRRAGADTIEVKKLFQYSFNNYVARSGIVKNAEIYKDSIAISVSSLPVDRTVAAQAADELLNIRGVIASFVAFPVDDMVYISGRSLGQLNVQMVLERMGGGGHSTMAAVQLRDKRPDEARVELIEAIDSYMQSLA